MKIEVEASHVERPPAKRATLTFEDQDEIAMIRALMSACSIIPAALLASNSVTHGISESQRRMLSNFMYNVATDLDNRLLEAGVKNPPLFARTNTNVYDRE